MLAAEDSNTKYSPPVFYKMQAGPKEFAQIEQNGLK